MLSVAREVWEAEGYRVQGAALSGNRHRAVQGGDRQPFPEQVAVDPRELFQVLVQSFLAPIFRRVEHFEQAAWPLTGIAGRCASGRR
ncbi:MAG: hypothetical protein ACRD4Q_14825 [Candidatus Acidiferrales bacterium]